MTSIPEQKALDAPHKITLDARSRLSVTGVLEMRRHLSCYFKGLADFRDTRMRLVTEKDPDEVMRLLDYVALRWGEDNSVVDSNVYGV